MQIQRIIAATLVFSFTLCPTATKEKIVQSKADQLIYFIGQRHDAPTEETREQFKTLMKILEEAEKKGTRISFSC